MEPNKTRLLIVDDEPDILEFIKYNLVKAGFQVFVAHDGQQAISMAKEHKPHLILLDIMMPNMDGVAVCEHLRARSEFDNTLIAFLTARNEDYSQIAALDIGGDDYIAKPIKPRVLVSRINALLRRSKNREAVQGNEIIKYGNLRIDKEMITVHKEDELISFAKKEFELLCLLISKPGKVYKREEIYNKIWGEGVIVGTRTIDVHIRKIREKLGDEYIKTIKGIGYKFEF